MSLNQQSNTNTTSTSTTKNIQEIISQLLEMKGQSQDLHIYNERRALIYFDKRANCECIRFLLAYGQIEYEDIRLTIEEWEVFKELIVDFSPGTQFHTLPILYMNGLEMDKTISICRYLGKILGLSGRVPIEEFEIDRIVENVNDLRQEYNQEVPCSKRKTDIDFKLRSVLLPFYLDRFNRISESGYIANGKVIPSNYKTKLTWGDFYFVAFLDYILDVFQTPLLQNYPNLIALCRRIHMLPTVREWIAKRPYSLY